MNQLVFKNNDQIVTSSRNVARDFEKGHREVLRTIDNIVNNGSVQDCTSLFHETTYVHEQNKQEFRQYLMNRDGFTLLVMGFTGRKAMQFKMQYINAFNQMEQELLKPKVLTDKEQLVASMKLTIEANEKLDNHDERLTYLEETMRIDGTEEYRIRRLANQTVVKALGGKDAPAYKELSNKLFARFWRDFKNHFTIPRYGELPKMQFDEGIDFINAWQPDTSTRLKIDAHNRQQSLKIVR